VVRHVERIAMSIGAVVEKIKCVVCERELIVKWSDTHGVGACWTCGLPYRIYHYENDERVEKPPSVVINDKGLEIARRYWAETQRRVFPAAYDMGMERGGCTYSGASREDCDLWNAWMEEHASEFGLSSAEAQDATQ
jgi:hypothetical protein